MVEDEIVYKSNEKTNGLSEKVLGAVFLGTVTGISIIFGFGFALSMAKKKDPSMFLKGISKTKDIPESGSSLALRALGWGTLYATTGFGLFCFTVWKALGVHDFQEFREKVGRMLPRIPKKEPQGRTEFSNLRELLNYIIEESEKDKKT